MPTQLPRPTCRHGLGGGAEVVFPVAGGGGRQIGRPVELAVPIGSRTDGADPAIGSRAEDARGWTANGDGQHGKAVIIDVLADQVDAPRYRHDADFAATAEDLAELLSRIQNVWHLQSLAYSTHTATPPGGTLLRPHQHLRAGFAPESPAP